MQAEARAAFVAPRREERIERFAPDIVAHTAAVVEKRNLDAFIPVRLHVDVNGTCLGLGKRVHERVEKEICLIPVHTDLDNCSL